MANTENLKPFKKGVSGNPKGRPKGTQNRATVIKRWLEVAEKGKNPITGEIEEMSQEDIITLAIMNKARGGDVAAYNALYNSRYGNPKDSIDLNTREFGVDIEDLMAAMKDNNAE